MTKSSSSRKIFFEFYKRVILNNLSAVGAYFAVFFITFSAVFYKIKLVKNISESEIIEFYQTLFSNLISPAAIIISIILSYSIFKFIFHKNETDFLYSLPITKELLFMSRYFAGLSVILMSGVFFLLTSYIFFSDIPNLHHSILDSTLYIALMSLSTFSFSSFIAVCSKKASSMLKAIITINMAYPLTALTILFLVSILVPGYELFYTSNIIVLTALAPCTSFFLFNPKLNPSFYTTEIFIIWWCTLSIVLFALSLLVYRKRCSHSNIITSSRKYIFCYSKSFIVSILGLFFGAWLLAVTSNHLLFFVGAFISSLVLYIAVDVIKSRKLNGLDLKHYSISIIVILVTYTVINFGVFGYDKRVPKSDNIQSVEISDYNSTFVDTEKKYDSIITDGKKLDLKPSLKNISSIESAVDFHEKIINGISRETPYLQKRKNDQTILLNYKLKNGTDMKRVYYKEELDSASLSAYFDIIDSEEYKKQSNILFNIDAKDVKSINIKYFSDSLTVKEVELGQELHTDIKQDILNSVKFDILQDNIQKQTKWKTLSNSTSYIFITFRSYESEYDNPDMKNILFFDRGHIIPSYYEKTINSLNKENLL